jgi:glutathione peroxidase
MATITRIAQLCLATAIAWTAGAGTAWPVACPAWLDHDFHKLHSSDTVNICKNFADKPLLLVNTASHCGFTPQFKGLEALHEKYRDQGLVVIGFPSNDFNQEAKDDKETAEVCYINYGVKFTMLAALPVKGDGANPVFKELARQSQEPQWNFNKYLVRPDGTVLKYFDSRVTPESPEFNAAIAALLTGVPLAPENAPEK